MKLLVLLHAEVKPLIVQRENARIFTLKVLPIIYRGIITKTIKHAVETHAYILCRYLYIFNLIYKRINNTDIATICDKRNVYHHF